MKNCIFLLLFSLHSLILFAQSGSVASYNFNSGDPGLAYNKYSILKGENSFTQIGLYKVIGSPYLLGEKQTVNVYSKEGSAVNAVASYNTYSQQVEVYLDESGQKILKKGLSEVDSFSIVTKDKDVLHFVNPTAMGLKEKAFLQVVADGAKYKLYKRYKSDLGYVSTNYIQSDLRQFDLDLVYYYFSADEKKFKKLKIAGDALIKEFKTKKDISALIDDEKLNKDPEAVLKAIFALLNT